MIYSNFLGWPINLFVHAPSCIHGGYKHEFERFYKFSISISIYCQTSSEDSNIADAMAFTPLTLFYLLLSLLSLQVAAESVDVVDGLAARQAPGGGGAAPAGGPAGGSVPTVVSCAEYSRIANLTIIGKNSTYRAAFLRSGPFGTDQMSGMVDQAAPLLPPLTLDKTLNQQCGNSTAIALAGAEANFTQGIVADFTIAEAPGIGVEGFSTLIIVTVITLFMGLVWMTME